MSDDTKAKIELDGDIGPLRQKFREAGQELNRFGSDGSKSLEKLSAPLSALHSKFLLIGTALAGGAIFKEAVDKTYEWTESTVDLAKAFDITVAAAESLKLVLASEGVETDQFVQAGQRLANTLRTNEDALINVGLKTRDLAGNLRPLNDLTVEAIALMNSYKGGTDRAVAASILFGKSAQINGDLAKITADKIKEYADRQHELGVVMSTENIAAFEQYEDETKKAGQTADGFSHTIGYIMMPVLSTLARWFNEIGPAAILVVRGALGGLMSAFWLLKAGVSVVFESINLAVITCAEPVRALGAALVKLMQGDFNGALKEITNVPAVMESAWSASFKSMADSARESRDEIWNLFAEGTPPLKSGDGEGLLANGIVSDKPEKQSSKKEEKDPSFMKYYDAALEQEKLLASQRDALHEYSKTEELAYWKTILEYATLSNDDRLAIEKKTATLSVEVRKQEARQKLDMAAEDQRSAESLSIGKIEAERAAAQVALDLEQITQVQFLEMEQNFAARKYQINKAALEQKLLLLAQDPTTSPIEAERINNQLLEFEQQHNTQMVGLHGQYLLAQRQAAGSAERLWSSASDRISGLWDKGIQSMMNGTLTWRNAFRAVLTDMTAWFATDVVGAQVKTWLAAEAKKLAVKMGFLQAEEVAQTTASTKAVGSKIAEATTINMANATTAGTGAASSLAGIPIVGPLLAFAAMAAMFAAVSSMGGKMKSARQGYSVPRGLNPIMQIHEEEQVLPKGEANVVRSLTGLPQMLAETQAALASWTAGNGGDTVNIHCLDSRSLERYVMDNNGIFAKANRRAARDFKK